MTPHAEIRPIAVGEALRCITSKCLCATTKKKAAPLFQPYQFVPSGSESIIHNLHDNH